MSFIQVLPEGGLTASHTTAKATLGALHQSDDGNIYRYVQNILADSIAIADGKVVYPTATHGVVSCDYTGGSGLTAKVVGVGISAIAAGSYGWILVNGYHDAVWTDAGVAASEALVGHTVDGEADTMADGEEELVFGYALAADTTTDQHTVPALVNCL